MKYKYIKHDIVSENQIRSEIEAIILHTISSVENALATITIDYGAYTLTSQEKTDLDTYMSGYGYQFSNEQDFEIQDSTKGVILWSQNGTRYRITVDNLGILSTTVV